MPSHMGVQAFATARNSDVEFFVHFILEEFFLKLQEQGQLENFTIESQKSYVSEIASDVWDHFISATQINGRTIEIWCQTTCYKGNGTGTPEPNKTYEVRETLVEGLTIRQLFKNNPQKDYRTIHFTVGDSRYTYQWFLQLKAAAYDKSIYIGQPDYNIFNDIASTLNEAFTESDKHLKLKSCTQTKTTLGGYIKATQRELNDWWIAQNHPKSILADLQADLVNSEFQSASVMWPDFSSIRGQDIKGRTNAAIFAENMDISDPLISKTVSKLLGKNPFLLSAIQILTSWDDFYFNLESVAKQSHILRDFLETLWNFPPPQRLVIRRLLLRIHTNETVSYIQDRDIDGVTEHNIYKGDHSAEQTRSICEQIEDNLKAHNILTIQDILSAVNLRGKRLINQARWFEAKNGTELKPSFDYVQLALEDAGYKVVSPSKAGLRAIGYHSEIASENVRPYTNLKVVTTLLDQPICLLKAKFFRAQEFPRRCKEEAFVGLTLKYTYSGNTFAKRLNIPLVMFIDMASDGIPPEHAVKRLMSFGWHVIFSIEELTSYLKSQVEKLI